MRERTQYHLLEGRDGVRWAALEAQGGARHLAAPSPLEPRQVTMRRRLLGKKTHVDDDLSLRRRHLVCVRLLLAVGCGHARTRKGEREREKGFVYGVCWCAESELGRRLFLAFFLSSDLVELCFGR